MGQALQVEELHCGELCRHGPQEQEVKPGADSAVHLQLVAPGETALPSQAARPSPEPASPEKPDEPPAGSSSTTANSTGGRLPVKLPPREGPAQWRVVVPCPAGEKLGIVMNTHQYKKPFLTVGKIKSDLVVAEFNAENPSVAIRVGDRIRQINDVGDPVSASASYLAQELQRSLDQNLERVEFFVERSRAWEVRVQRDFGDLGATFRRDETLDEKPCLAVASIDPDGALARYNADNPGSAVYVHDLVLQVNTVEHIDRMEHELEAPSQEAVMKMLRDEGDT